MRKRWLMGALAGACVLTMGVGALLLGPSAEEPVVIEAVAPSLVPPPPVRDNAPMTAAKVVQPQLKAKKVSNARGASRKAASRDQAAEWASPFDRRR